MSEFRIYKASPTVDPVEDLVLIFDCSIPECPTLDDAREFYEADATLLECRLFSVLPGGTYDQLLRCMLERSASLLRVPHRVPTA